MRQQLILLRCKFQPPLGIIRYPMAVFDFLKIDCAYIPLLERDVRSATFLLSVCGEVTESSFTATYLIEEKEKSMK